MKFPVVLQRFCYVTYESLNMYMNSVTWTISVVWNVQPSQCKTSLPLLLTFTVEVWGKLSIICVRGKEPRDTSWNKGKITFHHVFLAVPWLRHLIAGLSSQKSGYDPLLFHVAFRVGEVALGKVFCRVAEITPITVIQPVLHALLQTCLTHLVMHYKYFIFSFFSVTLNYLGTGFIRIQSYSRVRIIFDTIFMCHPQSSEVCRGLCTSSCSCNKSVRVLK
jgi:hypothetical protein